MQDYRENQEHRRMKFQGSICWYCGRETKESIGCFLTHKGEDIEKAKFPEFSPYIYSEFKNTKAQMFYPGICGLVPLPDYYDKWTSETKKQWQDGIDESHEKLVEERLKNE